jgi:NADPH2:quinone reductase
MCAVKYRRCKIGMKAIHIEQPGAGYRLIVRDTPVPKVEPGQVLIAVAAAGLNRADLLQAQGLYPPPPGASEIPGMEVSGTIGALGDGVTGLSIGDRVCALLAGGGYAEFAVASAQCVLPVPDAVSLVDAAGLPEAIFTAWTNIIDSARLKGGETLLVHGGTSGIGSIAIQMFAARGHIVFATAGSLEKCAACEGFGARRAINYRTEDFVEIVRAQTGGKGVDVILDMVGGSYVQRNLKAAALWGRVVNIAYQDGFKAEIDFATMLMKRLSLMASTLRARTDAEKGAIRDAVRAETWPLVAAGRIRPIIDKVFSFSEAQSGHQYMARGAHIGKILLAP